MPKPIEGISVAMLSIKAAVTLRTEDAASPATWAKHSIKPGTQIQRSRSFSSIKTTCHSKAGRVIWGGGRRLLTEKIWGWRLSNSLVSVVSSYSIINIVLLQEWAQVYCLFLPVYPFNPSPINRLMSLYGACTALGVQMLWEVEKQSKMGAFSVRLWPAG